MAQQQLGLFDTPPTRGEVRLGVGIVGLLILAIFCILPFREVQFGEVSAFIPVVDGMMLLGEFITATLLYAQAAVYRSRALIVLATGYVFTALLLIPHALSFPGAFAPNGLLGAGLSTTAWLAVFRRVGLPTAVLLYVHLKSDEIRGSLKRPWTAIIGGIVAAAACAAAITALTTVWQDLLPRYYASRSVVIYSAALPVQITTLVLFFVTAVALFRKRASVLDLWLLVAVASWLIETVLTIELKARFTLGFYALFAMIFFSHLIVMLALIAEANRFYARLALSTALREEERDARLMSMEAVAAAISHEVGQPVSAANMSASAALNWLKRPKPDIEMAATSLNGAIDSGHRAFDVIKSIRSMFGRGSGSLVEFDLNALANETAALLRSELDAKKIEIEFELDSTLPPVFGDRVLMQRVLLNLYTNAIEAIGATKRRSRRIEIRSMLTNGENILLEVSDTGVGISPKDLPYIFNAFISTKASGTGLGLSLCRAIVEENGGKLWASQGENQRGATFHLQLPRSGLDAQGGNEARR